MCRFVADLGGTRGIGRLQMIECVKGAMESKSKTNLCVKASLATLPIFHPDFKNKKKPGCGNWWGAKCAMQKVMRCERTKDDSKTHCVVQKRARCLEVCTGRVTQGTYLDRRQRSHGKYGYTPRRRKRDECAKASLPVVNKRRSRNSDNVQWDMENIKSIFHRYTGGHLSRQKFSKTAPHMKCYRGCVDKSRPDGKILANGFMPGHTTGGKLMAPSAWCGQELTGF